MQETIDADMPTRLRPSCDVPGRGQAFAPRRLVQVASALNERGATGIVQSICQSDFTPAFYAITRAIAGALTHVPAETTAVAASCTEGWNSPPR
jgi:hypothetical protein